MKKGIIFALIGFIVALAASTALGVMKGKKAAAAAAVIAAAQADSVKAKQADDSLAAKVAADSVAPGDTTLAAHKAGAEGETPGDSTGSVAAAVPRPDPIGAAPKIIPASTVDPAAKAEAYKQVARVLSAMKAAEAAKVLAFLSDTEVEGILRAVGPRQAADFMTNLPKERAAALSRRLLVPRQKEQGK